MKRILALVLSLLMVMPIGTAYAESEQAETLPQSPDMVFATRLGILDEYMDQTAPLTRIELASVFHNIMMSGIEIEMTNSKFFSDVGFETAAYADFVYQCGIMNGVGDGKFDPSAQVTYAQAIKAVVAFLGYSEHANAQGGYPYGFLAVAQKLGLIDAMPPSVDAVITVNKLASILRLATNVPLAVRITYGTDSIKFDTDNSSDYLSTYMGITRIRGNVTANYLADLEGNDVLEYGQVKIENRLFSITETSDGIVNDLGCEVDIYVKGYKESKVPSIIYYELNDTNSILVIDGEDVKGLVSGKIEYTSLEKDKFARIASNTKVIYNGTLASSYDSSVINPFEGSSLEGSIRLIDNNTDSVYDVVVVDAYNTYVVKNIVGNVIFNENSPVSVDLGDDFVDGNIAITNVIGQSIKLSEIEPGDVINVSSDLSGTPKRIVVTIDTFTGTLEGTNEQDNIVIVGSNEFKTSKNLVFDSTLRLGSKVTIYFNKDGKVFNVKPGAEKYQIGYLVDRDFVSGLSTKYMFRIFTSTGNFETLNLAEKVRLSDTGTSVSAQAAYNVLPTDNYGYVRQPVLYTVNNDGDINWIDWAQGTTPRDGLYMIDTFDGRTHSLYYKSSQYNFGSKILISPSTVIFNVPKDNNAMDFSNYYIETTSYYGGDGTKNVDFIAYSIDENGSPCASILVDKDGIKTSVPSSNNLFVVDSISIVFDPDKGECYKINGWDYSSGIKSMIVEKQVLDSVYTTGLPTRGDILQSRTVGSDVTVIKKIFNFNSKQFESGSNPTSSTFEADLRCMYGDVIYNDGSFMKFRVEGTNDILAFPLSGAKFVEVDMSQGRNGVVSAATVDNLYDTENYPSYSSKVVIRTNKGSLRTVVIYNGLGGAN